MVTETEDESRDIDFDFVRDDFSPLNFLTRDAAFSLVAYGGYVIAKYGDLSAEDFAQIYVTDYSRDLLFLVNKIYPISRKMKRVAATEVQLLELMTDKERLKSRTDYRPVDKAMKEFRKAVRPKREWHPTLKNPWFWLAVVVVFMYTWAHQWTSFNSRGERYHHVLPMYQRNQRIYFYHPFERSSY